MNFLPIAFAFILIFSILSTGFVLEYRQSERTSHFLHRFNKTNNVVTNAVARTAYTRAPKQNGQTSTTPSPPQTAKPSPQKTYQSPRAFNSSNDSKLNLFPLLELQTDPKNHPLYEISAQLLHTLYGDTLLKTGRQEYELLDALIAKSRGRSDFKTLADLYPEAPHLQPLFYQMLKGTNQYAIESCSGLAPLEDFFCLEKGPAIHFAYASIPLLEAIFGKKAAVRIVAEEKRRWETSGKKGSLSKEELTVLLSSDASPSSPILTLDQLLDFSPKSQKSKVVVGQDTISGLIIKKPI